MDQPDRRDSSEVSLSLVFIGLIMIAVVIFFI